MNETQQETAKEPVKVFESAATQRFSIALANLRDFRFAKT